MDGAEIGMMLLTSLALGAIAAAIQNPPLAFSTEEKSAVVRYWSTPGRYTMSPPKNYKAAGLWQVRLTVAGSTWLWNFNKARGVAMKPTSDITGKEERDKAWDAWIGAKFDYDRWQAGQVALAANSMVVGVVPTTPDSSVPTQEPPFPGSMPEDMTAFVGQVFTTTVGSATVQNPPPGDPPMFAEAVVPMEHRIKFDDGTELTYQDNTKMRPRYPYYRFDQGIISAGKRVSSLPEKEVDALIKLAGVTPSESRVMKAVSILEGGFDSVNTYDTGYVSVGFIQFASLKDGAGSLGKMLLDYKAKDPEGFQRDFRKFGLDVSGPGVLVALNWQTGFEAYGPDANRRIIEDKRLIAAFQRAGLKSQAFCAAQIRTAKSQYYPADDTVDIGVAGISLVGKIKDFIKSEAGMATL
ncbi:MAG: hypothetical protein H7Y17_06255, partial [Chlorobia bacterium]|nr:hypothetical protein [Fimbriimonadaceae bacterium]